MDNKGRGSHEEFAREDDKLCVVKWMDSRSVLIASTSTGSLPLQTARRWDKVNRKYINVDCPHAISSYNKYMGEVDLADRYVSYYRIAIRTKKWPLKVFWHFIDVAAGNSWVIYKKDKYACGEHKKNIMDLLDFKFYIAECLIADAILENSAESSSESEDELPQKRAKRTIKPLPPKDVQRRINIYLFAKFLIKISLCVVVKKDAIKKHALSAFPATYFNASTIIDIVSWSFTLNCSLFKFFLVLFLILAKYSSKIYCYL